MRPSLSVGGCEGALQAVSSVLVNFGQVRDSATLPPVTNHDIEKPLVECGSHEVSLPSSYL